MQRIVVLGGGFAGLWSAVGAARKRDELGIAPWKLEIVLVDRTDFHAIRVRNYERGICEARVGLDEVLAPIGVRRVRGAVRDIDFGRRAVAIEGLAEPMGYDRLVFALGSEVARPDLPGFAEFAFDVDTYEGAARLGVHLAGLRARPASAGRGTVLVIGGGLTGIEVAAEMPARFASFGGERVILADRARWIGSDMGEEARAVIDEALGALGVEARPGLALAAIDAGGAMLAGGERIESETIIWCCGMRAHPLAARFPGARDGLGRIAVDECLKVKGMGAEFAAGDCAWLAIDGAHSSVMSCQHARPMGRFAGHNAVCDLVGAKMLPLHIGWYVTVLDLGAWGAVYTEGWERRVALTGEKAKRVKRTINCARIYPPVLGGRQAILDAGAAVVQAPPAQR